MFAAFRPKQTTPGLLLCDGEHRDNATRLHEYERRRTWLMFQGWMQPEGEEVHEYDAESEDPAEIKGAWWTRTMFLLGRRHHRETVGLALQTRMHVTPGAPKLDAIVYELQVNKKRPNRIRSIK